MRFLVDENFPTSAGNRLVALGHDVVRVGAVSAGMPDPEIAAWANRENRIILTSDKDFGEIVHLGGVELRSGVILFRSPMPSKNGVDLADFIHEHRNWPGHFSVVAKDRVRMRPLGKSTTD